MGTVNWFTPDILQKVVFCVQQKNETHTALEEHERELMMNIYILVWTVPLTNETLL